MKSVVAFTDLSDSCVGQNKNFNLICLYQFLILKGYFKVITNFKKLVTHISILIEILEESKRKTHMK